MSIKVSVLWILYVARMNLRWSRQTSENTNFQNFTELISQIIFIQNLNQINLV